ncbi:MAG: PAS domain S-box protein [Cytophagaceae bacterium]
MQISDLILSRQDDNDDKKQMNVYRIILLLCSTFTLLLRYLFVNESSFEVYDPLVIRVAFSLMLLIIFGLTFFRNFDQRIMYMNYMVFTFYSFHCLYLIQRNAFNIEYILEFIILIIIICLAFRNKVHINVYIAFVFVFYSLTCILFLSSYADIFVHISLLGIFCGAILIFFDSRIEMEEELRVREDLLHTIFNESPDALFLADPETSAITTCNERAMIMFGMNQRDHIIGNNLNFLLKYPYSTGAWNNFKKKFSKKKFIVQELEFKTAENTYFWGSQAITEISAGSHNYWLVRITDIAERVKDKKTIEENRKILRQVIDLLPHQIFLKDSKGKYLLANKALADLYNTSIEQIIGKTDVEFLDPFMADRILADDREVVEKGKEKFIPEEYVKDSNGNIRILQVTKIPFYLEDEKKPGLLGIGIDITERVNDKNIIEENRQMLRQIIDLLPHQIYLKDSHSKFLLVNESVASLRNKTMDEIIGKTDFDLFPLEEAKEFRRIEEEVIRSGKSRFIPDEYSTNPDGTIRVMNTIKMPFYLANKKEIGLLGINIDITEAKMAEKVIRESELKYKMLLEQASDGIYLSDEEGNILEANPKACEMFGYSMQEFLSLNIRSLVDPASRSEMPLSQPDLKDRQSIILERKFIKKDGTPFTVEVSAKLLEDGRHQAIIRDITQRKHLENILKDNERKFRALIENSSDVILILDEKFRVNYASPSTQRILKFDPEKLQDRLIYDIVDPQNIDMLSAFLNETIALRGVNHTLESLRIRNATGDYVYGEVVGVNLLEDAVVSGIIINFHDITKRKVTEMELLNTNFELDSFVYKASHDLKAPLRSVMGLIKLAKLEMKDKTQQMYLDMMNKSVYSLDAFIKDLTLFSRNSRLEIDSKLIRFPELVDETLNNLMFLENAYKIKINKNIEIKSEFYSDITRIGTILNNLISNAFKYHRFENNSYINILIETDADRAKIVVEDNGSGIDPMYIDRIFDMFYRASEISYGSGLGLYIVKNAVNKLHGTIEVESALNKGARFKVVLPNLLKNIQKQ